MASYLAQVALAGGTAGVVVDAVLFPLDTIKTRLQVRDGTALPPRSFYRGLFSAMAGSFPAAAVFWTAYEVGRAALEPAFERVGLGALSPAGGAAAAQVAVVAVRNPFEVVKQQLQAGLHADTASAIRTILRVDGPRGFYAGYASTVAREIPFDAIQFVAYEAVKRRAVRVRGRDLLLWENALAGAVSGGIAAAVTTPLDVIKTRLMTQTLRPAAERYAGWRDAFKTIVAAEGARALFRGIHVRVAWISVGGSIFFGTYEEVRRLLAGRGHQKK